MTQPVWQMVQISDVLDLEFASAMSEQVSLLAWKPKRTLSPGRVRIGSESECIEHISPGHDVNAERLDVRVRELPLIHGFARAAIARLAPSGSAILKRLLSQTPNPQLSPLICTVPFFASVAERWPGPVIYWLTDLIAEYSSVDRKEVMRLDRRMCHAATLVCPNSWRLEEYLSTKAGCEPQKVHILPNATRCSNLLPTPPTGGTEVSASLKSLSRPMAGIIGNLAGNMDWLLIEQMIARTPWLTWVFVGPTSMHIEDRAARRARAAVISNSNATFMGPRPYGELAGFARSLDVAVLPYRRCEPTYSGSSTRFYEHLAACRPIISTRGLEELTHKEPLLTLFDSADEGVAALERLRGHGFDDGLQGLRWQASQEGTWQLRAWAMREALASRLQMNEVKTPYASQTE